MSVSLPVTTVHNVVSDYALPSKPRVYLHQFNQAYDETVYIPLSIAMLKSACMADRYVSENYDFGKMFFYRDYVENILKQYEQNDISAFSLYVWNERISLSLAEQIKKKFNSLIIFGGPSVENDSEAMLRKYPFIDYLVHGEGESTFVELLTALKAQSNLLSIKGISFLKNNQYYNTGHRDRLHDINEIPSPFLDGTLDEIFVDNKYKFQGIWETNRGCPFQCFTEDTKIITSRCPNKKAKDIQVGDFLMCIDENTHEITETRVVRVFTRQADDVLRVSFDDETFVNVTPEHPFYVRQQWIRAQDLRVGVEIFDITPRDKISFNKRKICYFTHNGKRIVSIEHINGSHNVVNLSCFPHENYFANYVLSHNCSFCYWGSNLKAKISSFDLDRLQKEIQWMSNNNIEFVYAADANFGILQRDSEIADLVISSKRNTGFPKSFFVNFSKNSGDRVFEIAKKFHDAELSKGTTLSLQSLDDKVLENVKRKNIKMSVFKDLQKRYRASGIPSYTELILPLPGETLTSFTEGIEQTIAAGEHDQIYVYLCRLLPNTELSSKENRTKYEMKTKMIPILSSHVNLGQESFGEREYEEILIQTSTMSVADCKKAMALSWMCITHICLKTAYFPALYLHFEKGLKFTDYLLFMMDYVAKNPTQCPVFKKEHDRFDRYVNSLVDEGGDGEIDYSDLGYLPHIRWPMEEVAFIVYSLQRDAFCEELRIITDAFLKTHGFSEPQDLMDELFLYQKNRLIAQSLSVGPTQYNWNWFDFFIKCIENEPNKLEKCAYTSTLHEKYQYNSLFEFVRFHVWYGRRRKQFYYEEKCERHVVQE